MNQKLYMIVTYDYKYRPEFFYNVDDLKNWFLTHIGREIPEIYVLEYVGEFNGVSDVIKLSVLSQEYSYYITAVNKKLLIEYKEEKNLWQNINHISQSSPFYYPNQIYNALQGMGINLNNVYENESDRISEFDVVNESGFCAMKNDIIKELNKLTGPNGFISAKTSKEKKHLKALNDRLKYMENEQQKLKLVRTKPLIHFPDYTRYF